MSLLCDAAAYFGKSLGPTLEFFLAVTDNELSGPIAGSPFLVAPSACRMILRPYNAIFAWVIAFGAAGDAASARAAEPDFNRDVRPIFAKHCLKCHGPDEHGRQGGLRFDLRDAALAPAESGERAIVPGQPDESELLRRVTSTDEDAVMPPAHTKDRLSAAEIKTLRDWIAAGAKYANHWAFEPVRRPELPPVKNSAWVRNPIDRFVLARLEIEGLPPSAEADRYALVRRVYLDLIGLPPTPEEAERFVGDNHPQAYERLVDQLLASPHYGERWARKWLDLARYADTNGYEKDRERSIWPYRDWVIRALNDDLPFDQFTIQQIAGDMLPAATLDQRIATGFHRNTMLNEEGGIDPLEFRYYAMTDRVATTGAVWLGLTLQCAQCHTHKFDPIPHDEYYRFMALLDNADEPELPVPQTTIAAERAALEKQIADREAQLAEQFPPEVPLTWHAIEPGRLLAARGTIAISRNDGKLDLASAKPDETTTTLIIDSDLKDVRAIRLQLLASSDGKAKASPANSPPKGLLNEIAVAVQKVPGGKPEKLRILRAETSLVAGEQETSTYDPSVWQAFDGNAAIGWNATAPTDEKKPVPTATFVLDGAPVGGESSTRWIITLRHPPGAEATLPQLGVSLGAERADGRSPSQRSADLLARRFQTWLDAAGPRASKWRPLAPVKVDSNLPLLTVLDDRSVISRGDITKSDTYRTTLAGPLKQIRALRLETLPDEGLPAGGPGRIYYEGAPGDFFLSELTVKCDGRPVKIARATETFSASPEVDPKNPKRLATRAAEAVDGEPSSGWSINGGQGRVQYAVFTFAEPLDVAAALDVEMLFERHYACGIGRFRLSVTDEVPSADAARYPPAIEAALAVPAAERSEAQRQVLLKHFLSMTPELAVQTRAIEGLRRRLPKDPTTLVLRERPADEPRPTFVHKRGEYLQPTERVAPGTFAFLPPLSTAETPDRLAMARWLVDPRNPLTARVTVNRQWAALFGRGIVSTLDDFGYQGAAPTHPELLDWLAAEFTSPSDGGAAWSMKRLHRLMVTSAAYCQSSQISPQAAQRDPDNRLLSRSARLRLDAEVIRDAALQAAGLLTVKVGGPSVYPPQPGSVTEAAYGRYVWKASTGADRYRRSLYTFSKRTAPFAMFANFDAPSGELCVTRRDVSNTPLQALNLLNDAMLLEIAAALGKQTATGSGDDAEKLARLFRRVLTRPPLADERALLLAYVDGERRRLEATEKSQASPSTTKPTKTEGTPASADVRAWMLTARALLNLDEAVTRN